ncbi:heterokaryon incompatibility protein-domain-containing protein [Xylariomycetidae sp. FL2044]|nr:heterokaryon incompatibility protein-domain-containing protein [Xylariomycetidae sp. FL2044]
MGLPKSSDSSVSPYRPLREDGTEIRIVTLLPNVFDAPIECELEHVRLEAEGNYEAVSYCWGKWENLQHIQLDGQAYKVTPNLFAGLRYLRHDDSPRRLWIDSLCINQNDMHEKSHQIQKMRDIYTSARQVLVWLGAYETHSEAHVKKQFDFMVKLAENHRSADQEALIAQMGRERLWQSYEELRRFLTDIQWFRRIWILQEVAVRSIPWIPTPEASPRVMCGRHVVPYVSLVVAAQIWCHAIGQRPPPWLKVIQDIWCIHHELMEDKPQSMAGQLAWFLCMVAERFSATVESDMIYALLGLLQPQRLPHQLIPDYEKNTNDVLVDYASFIIEESRQVGVVLYNSMMTKGLPSWVPDWKHSARRQFVARLWEKPYPNPSLAIHRDTMALQVELMKFTNIQASWPKFELPDETHDLVAILGKFLAQLRTDIENVGGPASDHQRFCYALSHLILSFDLACSGTTDIRWHETVLDNSSIESVMKHQTVSLHGHSSETEFEDLMTKDIWERAAISLKGTHLFQCADGSIGIICQRGVKPDPGDLICSIKGVFSEIVLRPWKDGYRIVGRCVRTVKCTNIRIEDTSMAGWVYSEQLELALKELWGKDQDFKRVFIY